MCRPLLSLGCALVAAPGLAAQESTTAAAITASGRTMAAALDAILGGRGAAGDPEARTLILLVDPSPATETATLTEQLRQALERSQARRQKTRIGVGGVGARGTMVLAPGRDDAAVVAAVAGLLAKPSAAIRNVYKDVRAVADALAGAPGRRELGLIVLENGDAEDDLEATVVACRRSRVVVRCIASESYLADSYWAARPYQAAPRKCELTGGDGAFVELPWGWLMQIDVANEIAPSSFASFGLSRLAAATAGSVSLYSPKPATRHQCAVYGGCLFCSNDHSPAGDTYWRARVSRVAPSTRSRRLVYQEAAGDPAFRALLKAWDKAFRAGLLRGSPSVKVTGNSLGPQRVRVGRVTGLFTSTSFPRHAGKARKLAGECERILAVLLRDLAAIEGGKCVPRYLAMAEFTAVMLQVTRVNLTTFAGWCEEIAPGLVARQPPAYAPPEVDPEPVDRARRAVGIGSSNHCLCHGVGPFFGVELPGGAALRAELQTLDSMVRRFETLHGHTPVAAGLHRSGIAHFWLTYPGVAGKLPRKRPKSSADKDPITERGRLPRAGGSSGGTAGPTTGK